MTLLERIAARFGFARPPATELTIFRNHLDAREAGFRGSIHPEFQHMRAWWPDQGERGLAMRAPRRVTISADMSRATSTAEGRLVDILRNRQMVWGDAAVWIEI